MTATKEEDNVFLHTAHGNITYAEFEELGDRILAADERGDKAEVTRLLKSLPLDPDYAMAKKVLMGKERLLAQGWDLTEANMKFGEGWLDE